MAGVLGGASSSQMTTIFHAPERPRALPIMPVWNLSRNAAARVIMNYVTLFISSSLDIRRHHCVEGKQGHLEPWLKSSLAAQFRVCVLLLFFLHLRCWSFQSLQSVNNWRSYPPRMICWAIGALSQSQISVKTWNYPAGYWKWYQCFTISVTTSALTGVEMHQQEQKIKHLCKLTHAHQSH